MEKTYACSGSDSFVLEKLAVSEGKGYKMVLYNSKNTYWIFENEPDILHCYWYEDRELHYSGSSSYCRSSLLEGLSIFDLHVID